MTPPAARVCFLTARTRHFRAQVEMAAIDAYVANSGRRGLVAQGDDHSGCPPR